ncbi:MAG TPA: hypothetical protein VD713_02050, partial [Sphingomonadales bacterium]|nr:hypothetical protein [Sphingomonadales bacterium]
MLDSIIQRRLEGALSAIARRLAVRGVQGEGVALAALAAGLAAALLAGSTLYVWALAFLVLNRVLGAIEKALARVGAAGDFSFYLSVTGDALFWGAFVLAFAWTIPEAAQVAAVLLFALMVLAVGELAFALSGARRGLRGEAGGALSRLVEET